MILMVGGESLLRSARAFGGWAFWWPLYFYWGVRSNWSITDAAESRSNHPFSYCEGRQCWSGREELILKWMRSRFFPVVLLWGGTMSIGSGGVDFGMNAISIFFRGRSIFLWQRIEFMFNTFLRIVSIYYTPSSSTSICWIAGWKWWDWLILDFNGKS